jgi:GT2 family glycosyltransferase
VYERGMPSEPPENRAEWVADFNGGACAYRRSFFLQTSGYVPLPIAYGMEEVDLALRLHALGGRVLRSYELRVFHDTDLAHHPNPGVTAASLRNIALLAYLRYPRRLWGIGIGQVFNRTLWLIRQGRWSGILPGLLGIPQALLSNRIHLGRLPATAVRSYLKLRQNRQRT